jgi:hypothetical protein
LGGSFQARTSVRIQVSFIVAEGIVGTSQKILYCTTEVKAVSARGPEEDAHLLPPIVLTSIILNGLTLIRILNV